MALVGHIEFGQTAAMADDPVITEPRDQAVAELLAQTPDALIERLRALADDLKLAYAPNTLRTWRADWRVWTNYCTRHHEPPLPVTLPVLRGFLLERIAAGRKRATSASPRARCAACWGRRRVSDRRRAPVGGRRAPRASGRAARQWRARGVRSGQAAGPWRQSA